MKELFVSLLSMSLVSSLLIIAAVLAHFFKLPKRARCALWACAAVRLIFPISFESVFSLVPEKMTEEEIREILLPDFEADPAFSGAIYGEQLPPMEHVPDPVLAPAEIAESFDILGIVSAVWILGILAMLAYILACSIRVRLAVRESVRLKENIFICDRISGAFVFGLVRPKIYISSVAGEEKKYIIDHERAHIKRLDHLWKPLGFLLLSVNWFNPVCWLGYLIFCKDIELACDERAIKNYDEKDRILYSKALLEARLIDQSYPVSFFGAGIKERVKNVLNYKKTTIWAAAASVLICGAVAVCLMTDPVSSEELPENNDVSAENTFVTTPAASTITTPETASDSEENTPEITTENTSNAAASSERPLTPAELELQKPILANNYEYAGFIADAEGNIIEYVPNENYDDDIPETSLTPSDIDVILSGLNKAEDTEWNVENYYTWYSDNGLLFYVYSKNNRVCTNLPAETGEDAYALEGGTVISAEWNLSRGNSVCVENDEGECIYYSHLSEIAVNAGDKVDKGQLVGYAGSTGMTYYSGIGYEKQYIETTI